MNFSSCESQDSHAVTVQVYGPHLGALYARSSSVVGSLSSQQHHFLATHSTASKIRPGGSEYELVYGLTAISEYLRKLSASRSLTETFEQFARHEQALLTPLLTYLKSKEARGVRIVGDEHPGMDRAPTVSFVVVGERPMRSRDVVAEFDKRGEV